MILFEGAGRRPRKAVIADPDVMMDMRVPRSLLYDYHDRKHQQGASCCKDTHPEAKLTL